MLTTVEVLPSDERPVRRDGKCFYCSQPIGGFHTTGCVLPEVTALVRFTITAPMEVTQTQADKETFEFPWMEGTHCADNVVEVLTEIVARLGQAGMCLCGSGLSMVADIAEPDHFEGRFVPWTFEGMEFKAEWVRVLDDKPHRLQPLPPDPESPYRWGDALAEISNRRCREGVEYICADRFGPADRRHWCEPCIARDAFASQPEPPGFPIARS